MYYEVKKQLVRKKKKEKNCLINFRKNLDKEKRKQMFHKYIYKMKLRWPHFISNIFKKILINWGDPIYSNINVTPILFQISMYIMENWGDPITFQISIYNELGLLNFISNINAPLWQKLVNEILKRKKLEKEKGNVNSKGKRSI